MLPTHTSRATLAKVLGLSVVSVDTLEGKGVIRREAEGFPFPQSVRQVLAHYRAVAAGLGLGGEESPSSLTDERKRFVSAQARLVELRTQILAGQFASTESVAKQWDKICTSVRNRCLALPSDISQLIPFLTKHDLALVDDAVRAALEELADGADVEAEAAE